MADGYTGSLKNVILGAREAASAASRHPAAARLEGSREGDGLWALERIVREFDLLIAAEGWEADARLYPDRTAIRLRAALEEIENEGCGEEDGCQSVRIARDVLYDGTII